MSEHAPLLRQIAAEHQASAKAHGLQADMAERNADQAKDRPGVRSSYTATARRHRENRDEAVRRAKAMTAGAEALEREL